MTDRDNFLAIVVGASKLRGDELRVAQLLIDRLVVGHERYGQLNLATDRRNWLRESADEALDLAVYGAIRAVVVADAVGGVVAQVEEERRRRLPPRHTPSPADAIAPPTKASAVVGARKGGPVLL